MAVTTTRGAVTRGALPTGSWINHERALNWPSMRRAQSMGRLRRLEAEQALPHHEEIRQPGGHHEPMPVLGQAAVAHLGESKDALDRPDRLLDTRAGPRLPSIRRAPLGRRGPPMDEVARV